MKISIYFIFEILIIWGCEDQKEQFDSQQEKEIEESIEEISTRANAGILSFTGETNLQVGLRQTYTIKLSKPLTTYTEFYIFASNSSAVRFTRITDNNYTSSGFMEMGFPANTIEIKFDMLPIKPLENLTISFVSQTGTLINTTLSNIKITKPVLQIKAPTSCYLNEPIKVEIPYSYAMLGDRVLNYDYNKNYLRYNSTQKSNNGFITTFYSNLQVGSTILKAEIVGKINSNEFYDIANIEHTIEIKEKPIEEVYNLSIWTYPRAFVNEPVSISLNSHPETPNYSDLKWYINNALIKSKVTSFTHVFTKLSSNKKTIYNIKCTGNIVLNGIKKPFSVENDVTVYPPTQLNGPSPVENFTTHTYTIENMPLSWGRIAWGCNNAELVYDNYHDATFKFNKSGIATVTADAYDNRTSKTIKYTYEVIVRPTPEDSNYKRLYYNAKVKNINGTNTASVKLPWNINYTTRPSIGGNKQDYTVTHNYTRLRCTIVNGELTLSHSYLLNNTPINLEVLIVSNIEYYWPSTGYNGSKIIITVL